MKTTLALLIALFSSAAIAATPTVAAPGCDLMRQAKATIVVTKYTYALQNGVWVQQAGQEVGRTSGLAPVIGENFNGCNLDSFRLDNVMLNGKPETMNVTAYVRVFNRTNWVAKRFSASYWLSSDNGRDGWAAADSPDLTTEKLNVEMNLEFAAVTPTAHADVLTVQVQYDDNAQ
jgi:hypothetical protein